jgi:competence protein ComGC
LLLLLLLVLLLVSLLLLVLVLGLFSIHVAIRNQLGSDGTAFLYTVQKASSTVLDYQVCVTWTKRG